MKETTKDLLKNLYRPPKHSHKGQNGKLTIIGGSRLFHGASLWALKTASRIVDMVFYATVPENEELTKKLKSEIYDFICVPRGEIESYIKESDAILIGPGMTRDDNVKLQMKNAKLQLKIQNLTERDWQKNTFKITQHLLAKFPQKKWIIDAGGLQVMEAEWLKKLDNVIITPHFKEFCQLFKIQNPKQYQNSNEQSSKQLFKFVSEKAEEYRVAIVLKGPIDIICSPKKCLVNKTGNEGMTKGGTGDVLAGLIAALACKNDLFLAAAAGVYINGLAADRLYKKVGPYFNASGLCDEIPKVMKESMEFYLPAGRLAKFA